MWKVDVLNSELPAHIASHDTTVMVSAGYLQALYQENQDLKQTVQDLKTRIAVLEADNQALKQKLFGQSTESNHHNKTEDVDETVTVSGHTRKKGRRNHKRGLPCIDTSQLPCYQRHFHLDSNVCPGCGELMRKMPDVITEKLEWIPAQIYVEQLIQACFSCRACNQVHTATKPQSPIPKSPAGASLLKELIINKYQFHLPWYRQAQQLMSQQGIRIPDAMLARWVMQLGDALTPLSTALWQELSQATYLQVDESPVKIQNPAKQGYFWAFVAPQQRLLAYELRDTRSAEVVKQRLQYFKGLLQTDGYGGYTAIKAQPGITGFACLTHLRRKFAEVVKISDDNTGLAQEFIDKLKPLYAIEDFARTHQLSPRNRKQLRARKAVPILIAIQKWLNANHSKVPPKSKLGQAFRYARNHWSQIKRYARHGQVEIDTNLVENHMRPIALGRKNWLMVHTEKTGQASALFYSLIGSCQLNNINPTRYIHYLLTQIHDLRKGNIDPIALLPHRIDPSCLEAFKIACDNKITTVMQSFATKDPPS